jgi:hypothetical protein
MLLARSASRYPPTLPDGTYGIALGVTADGAMAAGRW